MDRRGLLNDHIEAQTLVLNGRQATIWTALPCIVTKVNFATMTLECQPAIQGTVTDENNVTVNINLPVLVDVPIVFPSAGGFTITFPLKAGDEVLVVIASRCIDAWWQLGCPLDANGRPTTQVALETRMHDLSDGFAIPGPKSQPNVIPSISSTGLQIRNDAGTTYMELTADGKIKFSADTDIEFTGNLKVTGNILATGEVTGNSATVPIELTTHTHTSAAPGDPTSPPLP